VGYFFYVDLNFYLKKISIIKQIQTYMKKTLAFLIISLIALTVSAQIERKPVDIKTDSTQKQVGGNDITTDKQSRKERFKELDLTKEQKSRMKEMAKASKTAKEAIENNSQLSDQEKKKQLRELQKTQMQKVQAILTPEQLEKFKASKQNNP
jgi:Spy/CpxP family protein refolding chaperone